MFILFNTDKNESIPIKNEQKLYRIHVILIKLTNMELNIGDRVWVQEYDASGVPLRLHYAEVLAIVPSLENPPQVMVTYMDGKRRDECVPIEYIKKYSKKESF